LGTADPVLPSIAPVRAAGGCRRPGGGIDL